MQKKLKKVFIIKKEKKVIHCFISSQLFIEQLKRHSTF